MYDIAIIGGGPVGLAAAAHAIARGLAPVVFEQGDAAGHAVRHWAHVPMFSNWALNVDQAAARLLAPTGWKAPAPDDHPTGGDLVARYLDPLVHSTPVGQALRLGATVTAVTRAGVDKVKTDGRDTRPFELVVQHGASEARIHTRAVIDASGTWFTPNPAGANGVAAAGEAAARSRLRTGMPDVLGADRARYAGRRVAVLGGGHSAVGTILDLARLAAEVPGTEIVWLYRGDDVRKTFGGRAADQLAARGALGSAIAATVADGPVRVETEFRLTAVDGSGPRLRLVSGTGCGARIVEADELVVATGFRPDLSLLREVRTDLDPALECPRALAPLIDPNVHSCGTVRPHGADVLAQPDAGLYIAGMKSYGRAPTFLLATGYEQVRSIVAAIAGDAAAAGRVELVLPETGVCSGRPRPAETRTQACCTPSTASLAEVG